jgi:hypothetical protein
MKLDNGLSLCYRCHKSLEKLRAKIRNIFVAYRVIKIDYGWCVVCRPSIGKRVMHLRTTDLNGNTLDIVISITFI